jgi:putative hydrolase of the HAD superfamily
MSAWNKIASVAGDARVETSAISATRHSAGEVRCAAWLIDLDGTLYHQWPVRLAMATEILLAGARHLALIRHFRKEQERLRSEPIATSDDSPFVTQLRRTARAMDKPLEQVAEVIHEWMERRPGKWLKLFRRRWLIGEIAAFRASGGKTGLVSDYPAVTKLTALGVSDYFDVAVACGEPGGPQTLKPSPEGYLMAAERLGVNPRHCLVIGDRDDADGEAARSAGMHFRLLK